MKNEIKWQHGLPKEDGIYVITVCDEKVFTDTSYYNSSSGWEAYDEDRIIAWAKVDDIEPCTTRLYQSTDFERIFDEMLSYLEDSDDLSKHYYLANLSMCALFEDAIGKVISVNEGNGYVLVKEDF